MVIDWHSHLYPSHFKSIGHCPPYFFEVERLLEQQTEAGVDISVISNPMITFPGAARNLTAVDALKEWNEFAADLTEKMRGRMVAIAGTDPFGGDEFIKETERAIRELGLRGIMINSSVNGEYLDSPRAYPLYELACELDVPVFIHPASDTIGADKMRDFQMIPMVGRPCDTALSITRLVLYGVLERYPNLKLVAAHMGGAVMMLLGRMDSAYELRNDRAYGPWGPDLITKPPSQYVSQLYVDSVGFNAPGVMCAVSTFGADHVVMGSDFPPVNIPLKRSVDLIKRLPLAQRDKEKILGDNAARLLKL